MGVVAKAGCIGDMRKVLLAGFVVVSCLVLWWWQDVEASSVVW